MSRAAPLMPGVMWNKLASYDGIVGFLYDLLLEILRLLWMRQARAADESY